MTVETTERLEATKIDRMRPSWGWSKYHRQLGEAIARHLGEDWHYAEHGPDDHRIVGSGHQQLRLVITPAERTVTFTAINPAPNDHDGVQGVFKATAAPAHLAQWIAAHLLPEHQRAITAWEHRGEKAHQRAREAAQRLGPGWQVETGAHWATAYASGDTEGIFGEINFHADGTATLELHGIPETNADRIASLIEGLDRKDPA